jgi:hypothetical protein
MEVKHQAALPVTISKETYSGSSVRGGDWTAKGKIYRDMSHRL